MALNLIRVDIITSSLQFLLLGVKENTYEVVHEEVVMASITW